MQTLAMPSIEGGPLKVLCVGAHSDDIEIGCAGTILKLICQPRGAAVDWVVLGAGSKVRASEARASASGLLREARSKRIIIKGFRDGHFPFQGSAIKEYFEGLKRAQPDVIFVHSRRDLHQDHRLACELTWQTFRDHLILEYEVPKWDGDFGSPNLFVELDENAVRRKAEHILHHFSSQGSRPWCTTDTFFGLARLRGMESRSPGNYAEAFYCRKLLWHL